MSRLSQEHDLGQKPLNRMTWWFFFLLATFIASLGFQTFRIFTLEPTWPNAGLWLLVMALLFQSIGILAYDSYVQEKHKGNVQKPVKLFDWMIRKGFLLRISSEKKGNNQ